MNRARTEHVTIAGGPQLNCIWPRFGGLWRWENEWLCAFVASPCPYRHPQEAERTLRGVWKRGGIVTRRSTDGGRTWSDAGRVFDNSISHERQRHILQLDLYRGHTPAPRDPFDCAAPDRVLLMGRAWCGEEIGQTRQRHSVAYCIRSPDRGRSWESHPGTIAGHPAPQVVPTANNVWNLGGGRLLAWLTACEGSEGTDQPVVYRGPVLYGSEDHGASWHFVAEIARESTGRKAFCFPHLLALPSGRWLCFFTAWHPCGGPSVRWTEICVSDDEGLNWSEPRRICPWSTAAYPLLLAGGRIVLVFMRCAPDPAGLYAICSEDGGARWTPPLLLRASPLAAGARYDVDMGYPVAAATGENGFLAVYDWQNDDEDVPWFGGRSFIAGSFVELI